MLTPTGWVGAGVTKAGFELPQTRDIHTNIYIHTCVNTQIYIHIYMCISIHSAWPVSKTMCMGGSLPPPPPPTKTHHPPPHPPPHPTPPTPPPPPPRAQSNRHGPQRTQHTASTAATPRYPQGRRQNPHRRAGPHPTGLCSPLSEGPDPGSAQGVG